MRESKLKIPVTAYMLAMHAGTEEGCYVTVVMIIPQFRIFEPNVLSQLWSTFMNRRLSNFIISS